MSWLSVHRVRATRLPTFRGIRLKHDYKFATDWSKVVLPCATTHLITLALSLLDTCPELCYYWDIMLKILCMSVYCIHTALHVVQLL